MLCDRVRYVRGLRAVAAGFLALGIGIILFVMCRAGDITEDATWLPVTCLNDRLSLYVRRLCNSL